MYARRVSSIVLSACVLAATSLARPTGPEVPTETLLLGPGAAADDEAGTSVAISGATALVGARFHNPSATTNAGAAFVFVEAGGGWSGQATLVASDAAVGDGLGWSVALDGDTAAAGAPGTDDNGSAAGSAYVFVRAAGVWSQQAELLAADGAAGDLFGSSISVSGDTVVVGAPEDDDGGSASGSAYVFVRGGTSWTQQAKLVAADAAAFDFFGAAVAIDGDTAVVGAPEEDEGSPNAGAAYVFVRSGTTWSQQAKLLVFSSFAADYGAALDVDGDRLVIGAPLHGESFLPAIGKIFVYERSGTSWTQTAGIEASTPGDLDEFGCAVALDGDRMVVGARHDDEACPGSPTCNSGSVYVFCRTGGIWSEELRVEAGAAQEDAFGTSVALSGDRALAGAPFDDDAASEAGSATVLTFGTPGAPSFCDGTDGSLAACPCGNAGTPDSGCDIQQATGGIDLVLVAQESSPSNRATLASTGYPVMGNPTMVTLRAPALDPGAPVVFGDGVRCIAVPLVRLDATFAVAGSATHTFGHGAMAGAGTFHYQLWLRNNPAAYCTPESFNMSQGRSLTW